MPSERVVELLELRGEETVVDYGAGTGALAVPVARELPAGIVYAVDESPGMLELLEERIEGEVSNIIRPWLIENNRTNFADNCVDRILAVNMLHEVVGEGALTEIRRMLKVDGFLLVIDWRSDVERETGPPLEISLTQEEGSEMLREAGFAVTPVEEKAFPYHFVLVGRLSEGA